MQLQVFKFVKKIPKQIENKYPSFKSIDIYIHRRKMNMLYDTTNVQILWHWGKMWHFKYGDCFSISVNYFWYKLLPFCYYKEFITGKCHLHIVVINCFKSNQIIIDYYCISFNKRSLYGIQNLHLQFVVSTSQRQFG